MSNSSAGNALITGVSGSFGSEIAKHLITKDYRVLGLDIRENKDSPLMMSDNFRFELCDITNFGELEKTITGFCGNHGPFDVVINNAGVLFSEPLFSIKKGRFVTHSIEAWDRVISVCLSAAFYVIACTARLMIEKRRKGLIINISSISADGNIGQAAYSAAKAGLNGLTRSLSKELGPFGVRVVAIAPGFFDTDSTRAALSEEQIGNVKKKVPLQRLGETGDLLKAIDFVIANTYYDGKILELDGGLTI